MKQKLYFILCCTALPVLLAACNDWLDVKPKQFTEEADLFSMETGFKEALTGAYQLAAKSNLYGGKLTYNYMDKLAQRYRHTINTGETPLQQPEFYNFHTDDSETTINAVWKDMYTIIANLNNLLYWTDVNRAVLITPGYYEIIRGEALALRSYLYLDLLRMFGPVYKNTPTAKSIVYRTALNRDAKMPENADTMLGYIIADLQEAADLLDTADPLNFDYINKSGAAENEDAFLIFRFKRMNAWAVKALLARACLYRGDKAGAAGYATQVIDSDVFSLCRDNNADHILSSEIIFGLHIDRMQENITDRLLSSSEWVINEKDFFDRLFNVSNDGENDFRVSSGMQIEYSAGTNYYLSQKFDQTGLNPGMVGTMPMIRLAEMYYILAECATDLSTAKQWIDEVRDARGILPLPALADDTERMQSLETEYRKEFYGEGQLWYFYKRTGADADRFFNLSSIVPVINDSFYIFPLPDDEYQFGGIPQ